MKINNGYYELDLRDEILINKLIRNKVDYEGFTDWYKQLNNEEQALLVSSLFEFAYQAGADEYTINTAFKISNLVLSDKLIIKKMLDFGVDLDKVENEYLKLTSKNKKLIFKYAVYFFAVAESKVYLNCSTDTCSHWWHRDLLNDDIVNKIINNSNYFLTSKKSDI